ncbi:unnamed protein product [Lymnaea stagnalis]|uniref:Innexin n=1 Tax=Lymnaea stagnalis TaxID=6523 RepID=A0AAV2HMU8_LYMST
MVFFRKSLSEDFVDRYNHTWFFWSLLVLSVVTWLLPLSPTLHPIKTSGLQREYSAHCWCPSEFTNAHRAYTETICGTAFNRKLRNEPQSGDVQLQMASDPDLDILHTEAVANETIHLAPGVESDVYLEFFLFVKTPLMLFLFALCLKLPHYSWLQFASSYGGDLSKVLESSIQRTAGQDAESRRRTLQGILGAFSKSNPKWSAALWYLIFKGFMCIIAVGVVIKISFYLSPELEQLELLNSVLKAEHKTDLTNDILLCGFSIRSMGKIHRYTVQCGLDRVTPGISSGAAADIPLGLYKALYSALMFAFCALTVVNVLSLITWLSKLFRHRAARGLKLSLDGQLLVTLAHDNIEPLAGQELVETFGSLPTKAEENQVV